jgi:DNA-binding XRE family transcriptional regulator
MSIAKKQPEFYRRPGDPPHRLTRTKRPTAKEGARLRKLREALLQEFPPAPGSPAAAIAGLRLLIGKLKKAREEIGLSLGQLAKRTGMDKATLSRLENEHVANPGLDTVLRYLHALGKDVQWRLVDLTTPKKKARALSV